MTRSVSVRTGGVQVSRALLLAELAALLGAVETKNTMPILAMVRIEADAAGVLLVRATDLDVTVQSSIPATVSGPFAVAVDARRIHDVVRGMADGEIRLEPVGDSRLSISGGAARFNLPTAPVEGFPAAPDVPALAFAARSDLLARSIARTLFAVSRDAHRLAISGALVVVGGERCSLAATDGHRLGLDVFGVTGAGEFRGLVPRKAFVALRKLLAGDNVEFGCSEGLLAVRAGSRLLTARLLTGAFPDYEKVLLTGFDAAATVDRAALLAALSRVVLCSDGKSRAVSFAIADGHVTLRAESVEAGDAVEAVAFAGASHEATIGLNGDYVTELLTAVDCPELRVDYSGAITPVQFSAVGGDSDYRYVLMPLRTM